MTENEKTPQRIFKTGSTRIVADASMQAMTNEQVQALLQRTYPEVANATLRERTLDDGSILVEFLPQPGRKG